MAAAGGTSGQGPSPQRCIRSNTHKVVFFLVQANLILHFFFFCEFLLQNVSQRDHSDSHSDLAANFKDLNEFFAPGRGLFLTHLSSNMSSHVFTQEHLKRWCF